MHTWGSQNAHRCNQEMNETLLKKEKKKNKRKGMNETSSNPTVTVRYLLYS